MTLNWMKISALVFALPYAAVVAQGAQQSGTIVGFAVDSVRGGLLRDAIVSVPGTNLVATTDSVGHFRIDNVPVGRRSIRLSHPLLDTLALGIVSPERELKAGEALSFTVAIPSAQTIVARKCSNADRDHGDAALAGVVVDADTEMPAHDAEVVVSWTDYRLTKSSMASTPQRRSAKVKSDGSYVICGIPSDLITGVMAIRGQDSTAAVTINFERKIAVQAFALPMLESAGVPTTTGNPAGPRGTMIVSGNVLDPAGKPVKGARVSIEADGVETVSGSDGGFTLRGARAGTRTLSVRKLGFVPEEYSLNVSARDATAFNPSLRNRIQTLEAVKVSALSDLGLKRVGFEERKRLASGKFYSPKDIRDRDPLKLNYLLETAPMLRSAVTADGKRIITGRGSFPCLRYYIDGVLQIEHGPAETDLLPDSYLSPSELGAVEVYDKVSAPGEFFAMSHTGQVCSVVVIWTKFKLGVR
jgi:hypothetical protein